MLRSPSGSAGEFSIHSDRSSEHKSHHVFAIFVACCTFFIVLLFTTGAFGHKLGLFVNQSMSLSDKYNLHKFQLDVTPAEWSFMQTGVIYLWQGIWLGYGVSLICRQTPEGYVYVLYPVLPPILYIVYSFSLACNVAWLLIWDKEYMEVALIFINLMSVTLYICLGISMRRLSEMGHDMVRNKLTKDMWTIRLLVQNGIGFYAAWGTVAGIFNFAIVLTYRTGLGDGSAGDEEEVGSTVSLIIFSLLILSWFILDVFIFEESLRYLVMPYIATLISIIAIISKNWNPNNRNAIFTLLLCCATFVLTIVKCSVSGWRHYNKPIYSQTKKYRRPLVNVEGRNLLQEQ